MEVTPSAPPFLPANDRRKNLQADFDKAKTMSMVRSRGDSFVAEQTTKEGGRVPLRRSTVVVKPLTHSQGIPTTSTPAALSRTRSSTLVPPEPTKKVSNTPPAPMNRSLASIKKQSAISTSLPEIPEGRGRMRSSTASAAEVSSNPKFIKELEDLRAMIRTQAKPNNNNNDTPTEKQKEENLSDDPVVLQQLVRKLQDQLSSAEDQIEKLTKELRIERNLRQEAEKAQNNS